MSEFACHAKLTNTVSNMTWSAVTSVDARRGTEVISTERSVVTIHAYGVAVRGGASVSGETTVFWVQGTRRLIKLSGIEP